MQIIKKPIISEKMDKMGKKMNRYGFIVHKKADKPAIKAAVEEMFGVQVAAVNTIIEPAKTKRRYTRRGILEGSKPSIKKAIITLKEGFTIDLYSGGE
ncbi:MAG: 50S ribosomal protein L23 [Sphingobacteriales bacterium]|nr:50S ribosomal protein L23 [Sphingobacteriales bacterium]